MNPDPHTAPTGSGPGGRNPVALAFLLGWAISETIGLLRKGVRPSPRTSAQPADYAPRLTASQGDVSTAADDFLLSLERIVNFYRLLAPEKQETSLTKQVNELPTRVRDWL